MENHVYKAVESLGDHANSIVALSLELIFIYKKIYVVNCTNFNVVRRCQSTAF